MEIDTEIYIHTKNRFIVQDICNYKALLSCLKDESDYLISPNNIISKENIEYIETKFIKKIEGEQDE